MIISVEKVQEVYNLFVIINGRAPWLLELVKECKQYTGSLADAKTSVDQFREQTNIHLGNIGEFQI